MRLGEGAAHRGGFFRNDGQQNTRGAVGTTAALLPSMYRERKLEPMPATETK
jgi:hypothetical protein